MKQALKGGSCFILLLKNAGDEWEKLNVAVEKKGGVRRFWFQEY
jgi:hypothetical protein